MEIPYAAQAQLIQSPAYKVPLNGCSMPIVYYAQGYKDWASVAFGGGTISSSGCSITSMAMVFTYLCNKWVTPADVQATIVAKFGSPKAFYNGETCSWEIFNKVPQLYNITCRQIASTQVKYELAEGHPCIQSCKPGVFTSGGHFIVLTGYSGELMRVNDPNASHVKYCWGISKATSLSGEYTESDILKEGKGWWAFSGGSGTHTTSTMSANAQTMQELYSKAPGLATTAMGAGGDTTYNYAIKSTVNLIKQRISVQYETVTEEITRDEIKTADVNNLSNGGYTNLLSYPSLVEAPFITFKIGEHVFGKYTNSSTSKLNGKITHPNFISSLSISKISGQVNQYTVNLTYQISTGDDPNMLDKIFSKVGYGKVYISYGDYASPTFIYKEEEAMITNVSTNVDFSSSKITYAVSCTSTSALLSANTFDFPEYKSYKPSTLIRALLTESKYKLTEVFTGMSNLTTVINKGLIPSDDQAVDIPAKPNTDPLTYLQFLVTCMSASTNDSSNPLKDSVYTMTIYDDSFGDLDLNGTYFKITKISTSEKTLATQNTFDLDIGFPSDNQVMSFSVKNDNSWSLLYDYSEETGQSQYTYSINNKGELEAEYSPNIATSSMYNKMTESQKTWWTNMTQFPIEATVTLKGLIRSSVLMTYVRVNAMFYGQKHVSSGLYIITGEDDQIDGSGFRTTLALTRVAGDNDYIQKTTTTVTSIIPTGFTVETETYESTKTYSNEGSTTSTDLFNANYGSSTPVSTYSNQTIYNGALAGNTSSAYTGQSMVAYLWSKIYAATGNNYGTAGMMGNIQGECGFGAANIMEGTLRNKYKEKFGISYTNDSYTSAIMQGMANGLILPYGYPSSNRSVTGSGSYAAYTPGGSVISLFEFCNIPWPGTKSGTGYAQYGYGVCQWTTPGRKYNLYQLAQSTGRNIGDLDLQVEFMLRELQTSYKGVWATLLNATSVQQAVDAVLLNYEVPPSEKKQEYRQLRGGYGQTLFNTYARQANSIYL